MKYIVDGESIYFVGIAVGVMNRVTTAGRDLDNCSPFMNLPKND
jgi:hypothetical protein